MSKEAPPSRTAPQFVVRMPDDAFRDRIAEAAKANNRSMNAEIVARLEESFQPTKELEHMLEVARLNGSLQGVRDSFRVVAEEATAQLAAMAKANQAAQQVIGLMTLDFDELAEVTQTLLDGDVLDMKALKATFDHLVGRREEIEDEIDASKPPALRSLADAIRALDAKESTSKASPVARKRLQRQRPPAS